MTQQAFLTLKFANPPLENEPRTYLTADINAAGVSLPVRSTTGFYTVGGVDDYYLIVGSYTEEKAEIRVVDASDAGTDTDSFTVDALLYSHEASDPVTRIGFNKIRIYGLASSGDTPVWDSPITTIDIDVTKQYTPYIYEGSTYTIFKIAYYNSNTNEIGAYSDEITPTTFTRQTCSKIIKAGLRKAMTKVDENPDGDITWETALEIVQEGMDEIITRKRRWPFLHVVDSTQSTTSKVEFISKPTNLSQLSFLKVDDYKLDWITLKDYYRYTDGISLTGQPRSYTERDNKYYLVPTPDAIYDVEFDYYKRPATGLSLTSEVDIPFVPILIYFCAAQFAYTRGNDKRGDKMYTFFSNKLEQQVEEYGAPDQLGDAEYVENEAYYNEDLIEIIY